MKALVHRLINEKDKLHPDNLRKGELFVYSMFFLAFILIISIPYIAAYNYGKEVLWLNVVFIGFLVASIWVYKRYGYRLWIVNLINVIGQLSTFGTYYEGGGIYSIELYFGLVMCAWIFLVGNKASGLTWFGIAMINVAVFCYADYAGWQDFRGATEKFNAGYHFINFLITGIMLALIVTLYDNGKTKYVNQLVSAKAELEEKSKEVESKNEDIISSISYAKRIQTAVLPAEDTIYRSIPLSFILYRPRDIVSGDFFWFHEIDKDNYIIVCADCTGHGVPGAFMTVIGSNLLTQIVIENRITQPAEVMVELDRRITNTLKQHKDHHQVVHDGMDLSLLKVDKAKKEFIFTSAKRPAIFIRNKQLQEIKGSKNTLGGLRSGEKKFDEITMSYTEDDILYLFTDGYIDQFGGSENKKFMIRRFREEALSIHLLPMHEQRQRLESTINNWIGSNEQTDDMLVMGIRF